MIGLIYIKELDWQKGQGEFAYCMDINVQNKGYMTTVVQLLSDYAFDQLKLKVLQIIVHNDNIGSVRVAEKAGFIWQRTCLKNILS